MVVCGGVWWWGGCSICGRGTAKKWKHSCEVADGVAGCMVAFKRQRVEACLVNMGAVHGESLIGQRVQVRRELAG